jgi:putative oxidoreductase
MNQTLVKYGHLFTAPWMASTMHALLRIVMGALLIYHGAKKVFDGLGNLATELGEKGWPLPGLQAFMAAYIEFAGGILLVVGLFARPVAAMNVVLFSIITFIFSAEDPFPKKEKALVFLIISVYLFFVGPGKWSVDGALFKKTDPA